MSRSDCIETTWPRTKKNYGLTSVGGRAGQMWYAHRYAWAMTNGPIPPGMIIMHICDNPPCINVAHLRLGTVADNVADRVSKGRSATGDRNGARTHIETRRGSANGFARLTEANVVQIRERVAAGEQQKAIARELGMYPGTIGKIVRRERWTHVS